jgi:phosphoribosylformylglycinamidine (FGAM) synthase PurS component
MTKKQKNYNIKSKKYFELLREKHGIVKKMSAKLLKNPEIIAKFD